MQSPGLSGEVTRPAFTLMIDDRAETNDILFTCQKNYLPWARPGQQGWIWALLLLPQCSYPFFPKISSQRQNCQAHRSGMLGRGISLTYEVLWTLFWEHEMAIASAFPLPLPLSAYEQATATSGCSKVSSKEGEVSLDPPITILVVP